MGFSFAEFLVLNIVFTSNINTQSYTIDSVIDSSWTEALHINFAGVYPVLFRSFELSAAP